MCTKLASEQKKTQKCSHYCLQTIWFDDPYQFFRFLYKKVLIFRQCRAIWFTWQHLNIEVPLLVALVISDGQLLLKFNLYLWEPCY